MDDRIEAVQRMQNFIKENLFKEITLGDLARVSYFSPWYSAKIFKEYTGLNPGEYIRKLKLAKSALKLRDTKVRIIDVAYEMGFKSVDGYQRAFLKEFGCNPREYAKNPIPLNLYTAFGVKFKFLEREKEMKEIANVFIQVIEKEERKVIIKRGIKASEYFDYCDEVGCDVWGILTSMKSLCQEPVCLWLPDKYIKPNTSKYVQGVEVPLDFEGAIPDGFDIITLPKAKYLMFQGEPFLEENYFEAISGVQNAIEKYDPSYIGYAWDWENPKIQLEPIGTRGYIELMPIIQKP